MFISIHVYQVDQDKFRETQTSSGLQNEKNIIRNTFGINWDYVTWSDLRKPLYSGIAAALYTKLHSVVAWRIEDQANTYESLFQSSGGHNFTNLAQLLDQGIFCSYFYFSRDLKRFPLFGKIEKTRNYCLSLLIKFQVAMEMKQSIQFLLLTVPIPYRVTISPEQNIS